MFGRWFARPAAAQATGLAFDPVNLAWRADARMPIVDWYAVEKARKAQGDGDPDAFYERAALTWIDALRTHLGDGFRIERSTHFALLSAMPARTARLALEYCERTRRRILAMLEGIAQDWGHGPHVVVVFETEDQYYDYISHYYPESGEFAMSSGMYIQHGYGHFVFVASEMAAMEPIIAHELTHCLVSRLPLPAWLNEGTAVNVEQQLAPMMRDPRRGIFEHREVRARRSRFWNAETIQAFWSGKSFKRPDEGCELSYELAADITRLIARDAHGYRLFMLAAQRDDAGVAAAQASLAHALADFVGAILGDGDWAPRPDSWHEGTEAGQFRGPGAMACCLP